jgi:hypothetical protein
MTQDEEIEFERLKTARDALLLTVANLRGQLETIAAEERDACAKIAERKISKTWAAPKSPKEWWEMACRDISKEIRARGQA